MTPPATQNAEAEIKEVLMSLKDVVASLLDCASLDPQVQYNDCMICFDSYEWEMLPNANAERFQELRAKGGEDLTHEELDEFMDMVSPDGEVNEYFNIVRGRKLLLRLDALNSNIG